MTAKRLALVKRYAPAILWREYSALVAGCNWIMALRGDL